MSEDGRVVRKEHVEAVLGWDPKAEPTTEISFSPARVLLRDFTGVPVVAVDLAAMREALATMGGKAGQVNPQCPLDRLTASTKPDLVGRENDATPLVVSAERTDAAVCARHSTGAFVIAGVVPRQRSAGGANARASE